jgi:hypothetical protein
MTKSISFNDLRSLSLMFFKILFRIFFSFFSFNIDLLGLELCNLFIIFFLWGYLYLISWVTS